MSNGLVTIAVAGDGAEADSILRTLAEAASARGSKEPRASSAEPRTTARVVCSWSRISWPRRRRRCSTRMKPTTTTEGDAGTPHGDLRPHGGALRRAARARGAARRAVRVHGRRRSRRRDAAARRRLRHGRAGRDRGRAPGRAGVGRRRLRADAREGARAARARRRVQARAGRRPALPPGWFDAVTMRLVVHTLGDAGAGLAEARRVLAPDGRVFIWTFAPEHFTGHHLRPYLPDCPRSTSPASRRRRADGRARPRRASATCELRTFQQDGSVTRRHAAEQLRARHLSTIHLLPEEQVAAAAERLEHEAAAAEPPLATMLRWQLVVAGP